MVHSSIRTRIKKIQSRIGVVADGIIGPATLTALEHRIFGQETILPGTLRVSAKGIDLILFHEISSKSYYLEFLCAPAWPGGRSGVTIGIGYDLGQHSANQIQTDWGGRIPPDALEKLTAVAGTKGKKAEPLAAKLNFVKIPYDAACEVFYTTTLTRFGQRLKKAYPGVEDLLPDAQGALLSLVYNRGTAMAGDRRREMAALKPLVAAADYPGMADQILSMKRLWQGKGLDGLLKRRNDEARLILGADRAYDSDEIVRI